ncbi:hypothetical protein LJC34_03165, partial [Oscillospiraceae bacterium OttesenSCG-928-G22]|nr:hypothetical protein [Oscillospiraceae bacterium OttesenSCG-928-G22]
MEMLTAFTYEIDDPALAVSELLAQLDLGNTLKKNSIGVITCYTDFVDSGVIAGISESLPFDVIGCTSLATGTDGAYGDLLLCLTVLTGDDVSFSAAYTAPLENDLKAPIEEAYKKALSSLGDPPVMMLAFPPLLKRVGGAAILKTLDETSDGLPVFGTIACD